MADAVTTNVIANTDRHYVVQLTNLSDGTGETAVAKVDKSALLAKDGAAPASVDIEQVEWNMQGFTYILIEWDHTANDTALLLNGNGYKDFRGLDNGTELRQTSGLLDPRSTGSTGDLVLTTVGHAAGTTYDITLWVRKTND